MSGLRVRVATTFATASLTVNCALLVDTVSELSTLEVKRQKYSPSSVSVMAGMANKEDHLLEETTPAVSTKMGDVETTPLTTLNHSAV